MQNLWVEEFRPETVDDYVFKNDDQKDQFKKWIDEEYIPHLLLVGHQGSGKTSIALILKNELNVSDADFLMLNSSMENNVETVREKIKNFCTTVAFGSTLKIVLCDEFDNMSQQAQYMLRNLMETYSETCRFILTANYENKIIPALHSRCQKIQFDAMDETEFTCKVAKILSEKNIKFTIDTIDTYVKATYPDLRKCINVIQQNSTTGQLIEPTENDYISQIIDCFKKKNISEGRKIIAKNAQQNDYPKIYRFFYDNLDLWADDEDKQNQAILIIAKRLKDHSLVADPEINMSACLIELLDI